MPRRDVPGPDAVHLTSSRPADHLLAEQEGMLILQPSLVLKSCLVPHDSCSLVSASQEVCLVVKAAIGRWYIVSSFGSILNRSLRAWPLTTEESISSRRNLFSLWAAAGRFSLSWRLTAPVSPVSAHIRLMSHQVASTCSFGTASRTTRKVASVKSSRNCASSRDVALAAPRNGQHLRPSHCEFGPDCLLVQGLRADDQYPGAALVCWYRLPIAATSYRLGQQLIDP